jgi:hypothetical protein
METAAIHQSASSDIYGKACGESPAALPMQGAVGLFQKPNPATPFLMLQTQALRLSHSVFQKQMF